MADRVEHRATSSNRSSAEAHHSRNAHQSRRLLRGRPKQRCVPGPTPRSLIARANPPGPRAARRGTGSRGSTLTAGDVAVNSAAPGMGPRRSPVAALHGVGPIGDCGGDRPSSDDPKLRFQRCAKGPARRSAFLASGPPTSLAVSRQNLTFLHRLYMIQVCGLAGASC